MKVTGQTKVHYKGSNEDFIVFVDSEQDYQDYKEGKETVLARVVGNFKVYVSHKHGSQGTLDEAADSQLVNEFGTSVDDEVIKTILEKGTLQTGSGMEKTGPKNDSMGSMSAH